MTDPHHPLMAIDIALEPDAVMMRRAFAENAALRENFPQGFALDATHHEHITLLQGLVYTADLPIIYAVAEERLAKEKYTDWKLTAFKYYCVPAGPIGLAGIVIEPTAGLVRLQQQIIDAVAPHTVTAGAAAAFYTTPGEPDIHPSLIPYVSDFVPTQTGKNYSPTSAPASAPRRFSMRCWQSRSKPSRSRRQVLRSISSATTARRARNSRRFRPIK